MLLSNTEKLQCNNQNCCTILRFFSLIILSIIDDFKSNLWHLKAVLYVLWYYKDLNGELSSCWYTWGRQKNSRLDSKELTQFLVFHTGDRDVWSFVFLIADHSIETVSSPKRSDSSFFFNVSKDFSSSFAKVSSPIKLSFVLNLKMKSVTAALPVKLNPSIFLSLRTSL